MARARESRACENIGQRIIYYHNERPTTHLLPPTGCNQSKVNRVRKWLNGSSQGTHLSFTPRSPTTVSSPSGKCSMSTSNATADITWSKRARSRSEPKSTFSFTVSERIHGSCALYATPPARGRLTYESAGLRGSRCISPRRAMSNAVFPHAVGPWMTVRPPCFTVSVPGTVSVNVRSSPVLGFLVHVKAEFLISIPRLSRAGEELDPAVNSSRSSV